MKIDTTPSPTMEHHAHIHHPAIPTPDRARPDEPAIRVRVRGLGDGTHPIDSSTPALPLECEPFKKQVRIHGTLVKSGEQIHLKAEASAEGAFECTRCAEPFESTIDAPLALEFVPPRLVRDPNDPNVHEYDASINAYLDITEDVHDALLLAIPMTHLCRSNCRGLCPECGKDLNLGICEHVGHPIAEKAEEAKFPALKSLGERLRADEARNAGPGYP